MKQLEEKIGYRFQNPKYLKEALQHSSYANEARHGTRSNERLEFLGDSVLSIVVSEFLYTHFTHLPEGDLTKYRSMLVCERSLCGFARQVGLGQWLKLGKGEENTGGRDRDSILADAFEALIAAIYLDGGMEQARDFVLTYVKPEMASAEFAQNRDYKTALQEVIQRNREEKVTYELVDEHGPDHDKSFTVEVHLNSNVIGRGTGKSKKEAEQLAAREALALMGL